MEHFAKKSCQKTVYRVVFAKNWCRRIRLGYCVRWAHLIGVQRPVPFLADYVRYTDTSYTYIRPCLGFTVSCQRSTCRVMILFATGRRPQNDGITRACRWLFLAVALWLDVIGAKPCDDCAPPLGVIAAQPHGTCFSHARTPPKASNSTNS